jgi:hypothetical protein
MEEKLENISESARLVCRVVYTAVNKSGKINCGGPQSLTINLVCDKTINLVDNNYFSFILSFFFFPSFLILVITIRTK